MPSEQERRTSSDGADADERPAWVGARRHVVEARLHVEIDGAHVEGDLVTGAGPGAHFVGWAGLIGSVLAAAGHDLPAALTPELGAGRSDGR